MKTLLAFALLLGVYSLSYTMDIASDNGATQQQLLKESN